GTGLWFFGKKSAHFYHIIDIDFRCLVGPAITDIVDHFRHIGITQDNKFRHGKGHAVVRGFWHAATAQGDLEYRVGIFRIYRTIAIKGWEDTRHAFTISTVTNLAILGV